MDDTQIYDVAIVGYGPVGAALAILLGQRGQRVVVLERHPSRTRCPGPCTTTTRWPASSRPAAWPSVPEIVEPADVYEFERATARRSSASGGAGNGPSGWPQSSMFSQPSSRRCCSTGSPSCRRSRSGAGVEVTGSTNDGDTVVVHAGRTSPLRARYVVGCDGANSTVRSLTGIPMTDLGFFYDWLIVDVVLDEPRVFDPLNVQICDPARPTTVVSGGPGRRRWEFMRLPGEPIEELNEEATAWRLLAPLDAHPDNARLESTPCTASRPAGSRGGAAAGCCSPATPPTRCRRSPARACAPACATPPTWRGSSTSCSGPRPGRLLDAYGLERGPNTRAVIELAMDMGKLICVADPAEAAARDEALISAYDGGLTDIPPFPPFTAGIVLAGTPYAGGAVHPGRGGTDGRRVRSDDASAPAGARDAGRADNRSELSGVVRRHRRGRDPARRARWIRRRRRREDYRKWFADRGVVAALQRPDFVLFGTAAAAARAPRAGPLTAGRCCGTA